MNLGSTKSGKWVPFLVLFSVILYFWNVKAVPSGYYYDAASNALNALCLSLNGTDEYGTSYPLWIRAFDDYRPPLLIYLFAWLSRIVPLELYNARLLSMFLGFLGTVFFWLGLRRCKEIPSFKNTAVYGVCFSLTLLSSWVLVVHRMPTEFVVSLAILSPLFFLSWELIKAPHRFWLGALVGGLLVLCLYGYYGTKPVFFYQGLVLLLFCVKRQSFVQWVKNHRGLCLALLVAFLGALPTLVDLLGEGKTLTRYRAIGGGGFSIWDSAKVVWRHLDLRFFFFSGDRNWRHHTQFLGELNLFFLPFFLAGLWTALKTQSLCFRYFLLLFFLGLSGVSVSTEGVPHALRTLPLLPPLLVLCAMGIAWMEEQGIKKLFWNSWCVVGVGFALVNWYQFQFVMPLKDHDSWSSFYPRDLSSSGKAPLGEHSIHTVDERYLRVLREKDLGYCGKTSP